MLFRSRFSLPYNGKDFDTVSESYFEISNDFHADAILIGRETVQKHYFNAPFTSDSYTENRDFKSHHGSKDSNRLTIIADSKGSIKYTTNHADGENIIAILGQSVSKEYLEHLQQMGISYLFAGEGGKDIKLAMHILYHEFNIKKLILEGGGIINGSFLKESLIDELSLMIYPGIDGLAGSSTIFDFMGGTTNELPAGNQTLELIQMEPLNDGIVWLVYKFHS